MKYACNFILKNSQTIWRNESHFLPFLSKLFPPAVMKARHSMKTTCSLSLLIFLIHLHYKRITIRVTVPKGVSAFPDGLFDQIVLWTPWTVTCISSDKLIVCSDRVFTLLLFGGGASESVLFTSGRSLSEDIKSWSAQYFLKNNITCST